MKDIFEIFTVYENRTGDLCRAYGAKENVVALVAGHFADRMPSEDWMIIDDRRGLERSSKNEPFYVTKFREEEMETLCQTEQQEDLYTQMWKEFFCTCSGKRRIGLPEICFRYDTENM